MPDEKPNVAPFDWNNLMTKVVGALLIALAVWVWTTHERVARLEETNQRIEALEDAKSKFWKINSQTKNYINDLVDELEDSVQNFDFDKLKWEDLDSE